MNRGIPIPNNQLVLARMVDWYSEELLIDFKRTNMIVSAIILAGAMGTQNQSAMSSALQAATLTYKEALFPSEKLHKKTVEEYKELLEKETQKEYFINTVEDE